LKKLCSTFNINNMLNEGVKDTEWLAPIPEEEYLKNVDVGRLTISSTLGNGSSKTFRISNFEDIINDIWEAARNCNSASGISGQLSWTPQCHVSQLIEGKTDAVNSLRKRISKDPGVVIYKEFRKKKLRTVNPSINVSVCCSFDIIMMNNTK